MKFLIKLKNGIPVDHPIAYDNFVQAYPDIDPDNLPENFGNFVRVDPPILGPYQKEYINKYELVGNVYTDVYEIKEMTSEEILHIQNEVKQNWSIFGFQSWQFNEEECKFESPVPYPSDGLNYIWNESIANWEAV